MITELLAAVFVLTTRFQYSNYLNIFCLIYAFSGYVVNILLNVRNSIGYEVTYTHYDQWELVYCFHYCFSFHLTSVIFFLECLPVSLLHILHCKTKVSLKWTWVSVVHIRRPQLSSLIMKSLYYEHNFWSLECS